MYDYTAELIAALAVLGLLAVTIYYERRVARLEAEVDDLVDAAIDDAVHRHPANWNNVRVLHDHRRAL